MSVFSLFAYHSIFSLFAFGASLASTAENNTQSHTKQLCGFRGLASDPASNSFEAPCFRSVDRSFLSLSLSFPSLSLSLLSWPGNDQHAEECKLHRGLLSGALPNYHVGSELTLLRLLDSRGVCKSHEDQYYSAVVIKSPTLRAAIAKQGATHSSKYTRTYANVSRVFTAYVKTKYEHSKLNTIYISIYIYHLGEYGTRSGMLSVSQIKAIFPCISRSFVLGGAGLSLRRLHGGMHARCRIIKRKEDVEVETNSSEVKRDR